MFKKLLLVLLALTLLAACDSLGGSTGDTNADVEAAQNYLPNIQGYAATNADNLVDAISSAAGGASLLSGNLPLAGAVAKIDDVIQCYQDVGAVAANIYTPTSFEGITEGQIPAAGVVAVINQERVANNFLACALGQRDGVSAQAATLEPCAGSGNFTINDNTLHYLYAATSPVLCSAFELHFNNVRTNQGN